MSRFRLPVRRAVGGRSGLEGVSRRSELPLGAALPGRVWQTRSPLWVEDVRGDVEMARGTVAPAAGLNSGFAVPMAAGAEITGVLEFFTRRIDRPDEEVLTTM